LLLLLAVSSDADRGAGGDEDRRRGGHGTDGQDQRVLTERANQLSYSDRQQEGAEERARKLCSRPRRIVGVDPHRNDISTLQPLERRLSPTPGALLAPPLSLETPAVGA
jgi:hypothetical protein